MKFKSLSVFAMIVWLLAQCAVPCSADESSESADIPASLAGMMGADAFRVDLLPFLRVGMQTHQFCSYDRAGDNYDAEYFALYTETNGECVIFDAMGPGCLYRHHMNIWHDHQIFKGIRIRYYFDDESKPRIDMDVSTFFSTNNPLGIFQEPLACDGKSRFRILYHPMFFKKRLKVALSAEPGGTGTALKPWTGSYKQYPNRRNHWYEYTYQLFTEDPGLESWTPEAGRRMMPALLSVWNPGHSDSHVKAVRKDKDKSVTHKVGAGKTVTLWQTSRPGFIAGLQFNVSPTNNVDALFDTWLKITFDNAATPQIEAPIGCFFGAYRTAIQSNYNSLVLGYSNNGGYCYFPMPFWSSATIQVENRGHKKAKITASIDFQSAVSDLYPQDRCGYFHAQYHREDPRIEGRDYTYLETSGSGQVVGHVVARWNTSMEEDERTYFDGSKTPQIIGEGFEDDHDMGWGLQNLTCPIFGAVSAKGGAGDIYRFLLPDMYCFCDGVEFGHQVYGPHTPLGHEGMYRVGTEESVAFWYGVSQPRLIQTDEMDVGNTGSETAHSYHARGDVQRVKGSYWYDGEFNNVLFKTPATTDDGVSFTNSSTFTIAISPDNHGVRLRRRCDKANNRQLARVYVDDSLVTERPWYSVDYETTYRDIRWFDSDFEIPESYTKGKAHVTIRLEFVNSATGRWDEYHFWAYCYQ